MPNMSYCKFENTFKDLAECQDALANANSVNDLIEKSNEYEKPYIKRLIKLCREIADDFDEQIED